MKVILAKPVVTEKSLALAKKGQYTFWVEPRANKFEIARAVEEGFGVKVDEVRTVAVAGKTRRRGKGRRPVVVRQGKKAIVKLVGGAKIDLFSEFTEEKGKK